MAGAGVKLFLSGEVALAADVNQFLMDQVICRFADAATRDLAFGDGVPVANGGSGKPALSEGRFCYLEDDGSGFPSVQYYDGSTWVSSSQFTVADGSITEAKLADNSVTSAKIAPGTVIAADIGNNTITEAKLTTSVAGNGLSGGNGTALAVNVDNSTIEINSDALRLKDAGITSAKLASNLTLTGTTEIDEIFETFNIDTNALTASVNVNIQDGGIRYYTTSASANWQWVIGANSTPTYLDSVMDTGQSLTIVLLATNGVTAYKPTAFVIPKSGGLSTVTTKWFGGNSFPSGNSNSIDAYNLTIVKTASDTFTIFASQSKFA